MNKLKNQSGFSAVEALLILVIIGILGFTGWYVYHAKQTSDKNYATAIDSAASAPKKAAAKSTTTTTPNPYAGWSSGSLKREGLRFKYPSTWTLADNSQTAGVCAPNAQNCPDRSLDSVTITAPSGLEVYISAGENPANLTLRLEGQGCPASQDTRTQYANTPVTVNGKHLYMVVWGYKEFNVAENLYVGLTQYPKCILNCVNGLGTAQKLSGGVQVLTTYPNRNDATYTTFASDASVKDAQLIIESLHY